MTWFNVDDVLPQEDEFVLGVWRDLGLYQFEVVYAAIEDGKIVWYNSEHGTVALNTPDYWAEITYPDYGDNE